jgi:hypothetical protein
LSGSLSRHTEFGSQSKERLFVDENDEAYNGSGTMTEESE